MRVQIVRNVHEALIRGLDAFKGPHVRKQKSRNGETLEYKTPVTTVYQFPMERVLFWKERDANPFFHFFEGLWMLGGRSDVDSVSWFNERMKTYSDDGVTFNGAYGRRWRNYFNKDQLSLIIERLKSDPDDRRCVLSMWDSYKDLLPLDETNSVDLPCNTQVYFKIREEKLNMTVCCRSNDMIWGAYGANAVHFSMLQEYMAGMLGVSVGVYTQISDSLHVYTEVYKKLQERLDHIDPFSPFSPESPYTLDFVSSYPMFTDADTEAWDSDLQQFLAYTDQLRTKSDQWDEFELLYINPFFTNVAVPIVQTWKLHRTEKKTQNALEHLERNCHATDWALACAEWLTRRIK